MFGEINVTISEVPAIFS